ncbi:hypothetical protein FB565_003812 [Actinoplanes lutulentus]|uniref:N-acetyltransferase domain-containing protein n=1 Tax=Actinoplanes lutulentus TaxID=1287878 RepID=A0A327ZNB1_9ACTN|nr:hypothetical protein [Actinoplanes lutulentus]MBB2944083.1 hypothetical protein [Actinoplanes lutulentus]RAK42684.1 hypothetical protein B0I29_102509 [Actinoplanes lutulentus]
MEVQVLPELPENLYDDAWAFYQETFSDLAILAVNRHLMYRHEFDELMADKRADKYVAIDSDGGIVGLGVMTNELDAVPLISPKYFEYHWPDLFEERRLFYVVFVGASVGTRGAGVFISLLRSMYKAIGAVDGKVFVDICSYNEERNSLPRMISMILGRVAGQAQPTRLDAQSFWMYEFPPPGTLVREERRSGFRERRGGLPERRGGR